MCHASPEPSHSENSRTPTNRSAPLTPINEFSSCSWETYKPKRNEEFHVRCAECQNCEQKEKFWRRKINSEKGSTYGPNHSSYWNDNSSDLAFYFFLLRETGRVINTGLKYNWKWSALYIKIFADRPSSRLGCLISGDARWIYGHCEI